MNLKIKGNIKNQKDLEKIVQSKNVLHSYLFLGKEGIGKKQIAKEFAKKILCIESKEDDCKCKSCTCFITNNHPDVQIINEESETIKIATIREFIKSVYEKPILSEKKIFIINDADKMTKEAQNSLLKTLEEPPEYIVIILIASNADMLLTTIKSRCTKIAFEKLTTNEIKEILAEKNIPVDNIPEKMYNLFDGSIERALKILENKEIYEKIEKLVNSLTEKTDKIDFLTKNKEIFIKEEIYGILEYLSVNLFYLGKTQKSTRYLNCVKHVQETINHLKSNSNFDMSIDYMLFEIWEEVNEDNSRS